jgi:flagellar hook-associated protein 1 FlgK
MSFSLTAALGVATGGLSVINQDFAVISQNVANAQTAGYATEQTTQSDLDVDGQGLGVAAGPTQLLQDIPLQNQLNAQNATAAGAQVTDSALSALQPVLGSVGASNDLGSLLGAVQTGFSALLNDPSSQPQQEAVVNAAQALTTQINTLSGAYGQARQNAQNALGQDVTTLNTALATIGALSTQIVALQAQGLSTADLQNQRNAQAATISGLVSANFVTLPNGGMQVFTSNGAVLPTDGQTTLSIASAQTGPSLYYPGGGLPGIMLGGTDISSQMGGGAIGAALTLRDTTLPTYQASLDEFSDNLATRFQAQGLTLFSDGQGNVPVSTSAPVQSGYLGFSSVITVNPAVVATPSLVRDGTQAVAGSASGASAFTPNPNGEAGFNTLIERVLNYALGTQAQAGVPQPAGASSGLGAAGTLATSYDFTGALGDYANALTSSQSADSATATSASTEAGDAQTALNANLQAKTGVSMDSQLSLMVQLQNAYGANAKIVSTIQQMYTALLNAVQG